MGPKAMDSLDFVELRFSSTIYSGHNPSGDPENFRFSHPAHDHAREAVK